MIIQIDDDNRIHGTPQCWQIEVRKIRKASKANKRLGVRKGERHESWKPVSFHNTLAQAVRSFGEMQVRTASDLANALDRVERLHDAIETFMGEHLDVRGSAEQRAQVEALRVNGAEPAPDAPTH